MTMSANNAPPGAPATKLPAPPPRPAVRPEAPRQQYIQAMTTPEHKIRALPHETLVVHGREDKVIPLSNALTLASLIPRAQLHVYPHCGHWTQIEWASSFNDMVGRFLAND